MSRIIPEKIHLDWINIFKSNLNASDEYLDTPVEPDELSVGFSQESALNLEDKKVRIRLDIRIEGYDREKSPVGLRGEYGIEFFFTVDNLEDFIEEPEEGSGTGEETEDQKLINSLLAGTLMGIVYSTARGIILERTHGTFFKGVVLPVINPNELLK